MRWLVSHLENQWKKYKCRAPKLQCSGSLMNEELCPVCDSKLSPGAKVCDVCGADLSLINAESHGVICPECGNELLEMDTTCPKCGASLQEVDDKKQSEQELLIFQCPACNAEVPSDAKECPNCGVQFVTEEELSGAEETLASVESVPNAKLDELSVADELADREVEATIEQPAFEVKEEPMKSEEIETVENFEEKSTDTEKPEQILDTREEMAKERKSFFSLFGKGKRKEETVKADTRPPMAQNGEGRNIEQREQKKSQDEISPMIEEIKQMLRFASEATIDIGSGKKYLDDAMAALKNGRNDEARRNIETARKSIDADIQGFFALKFETMRKQIDIEGVSGERRKQLEDIIANAKEESSKGRYMEAMELVKKFQSELSPKASQFGEAGELIQRMGELLRIADEFEIDCSSSRIIYNEAKKQLAIGDWNTALILAKQSYETLMKSIPESLAEEMKKAKEELIEAKLEGANITTPVLVLKEANGAYNSGRYDETLRFLGQFRKEFELLMEPIKKQN
jgi:ribosomal protein L40E